MVELEAKGGTRKQKNDHHVGRMETNESTRQIYFKQNGDWLAWIRIVFCGCAWYHWCTVRSLVTSDAVIPRVVTVIVTFLKYLSIIQPCHRIFRLLYDLVELFSLFQPVPVKNRRLGQSQPSLTTNQPTKSPYTNIITEI